MARKPKKVDLINHPPHYTTGNVEVIEMIEQIAEHYKGDDAYNIGCVVKYVARAPHKGSFVQDLQKAKWYLDNMLANYVDMDTGEAL